ncbi:unnamed protein product, partial [Amoebophrya sp. A120]|eukprot:GSA120T00019052001.1
MNATSRVTATSKTQTANLLPKNRQKPVGLSIHVYFLFPERERLSQRQTSTSQTFAQRG